jgi:hypothetical protein
MVKSTIQKVRRELIRVCEQIASAPVELWRRLTLRRRYDRFSAQRIRKTTGAIKVGPEVAVYLIFPSRSVQGSHRFALTEMRRAGISPIVVSNHPLNAEDRITLSEMSAYIIERPNVGYDFGGYRDGILSLTAQLPSIERLWILNDSVWLIPQPLSWFDQARALKKDYVAATSSCGLQKVDPENFREVSDVFSTDSRHFHYASYALSISHSILRDPRFLRFWQKYNLTDDKHLTVRRGERGLTRWVIRNGYSHGATFEVDQLGAKIAAMDDLDRDQVARELVIFDNPTLERVRKEVLKTDPNQETGKLDRAALIMAVISRCAAVYSLSGYALRHHGFQFIKKSPLWHEPDSARILMRLLKRIEGAEGAQIRAEAATMFKPVSR